MTMTAARNMAAEVGLDARNHTPFKAESCRPNGTRSGASAGTGLGDGCCGLDMCQWLMWGRCGAMGVSVLIFQDCLPPAARPNSHDLLHCVPAGRHKFRAHGAVDGYSYSKC